jgi:hypothetical protein
VLVDQRLLDDPLDRHPVSTGQEPRPVRLGPTRRIRAGEATASPVEPVPEIVKGDQSASRALVVHYPGMRSVGG